MIAEILNTTAFDKNSDSYTVNGTTNTTTYSSPKITSTSHTIGTGLQTRLFQYVLSLDGKPNDPTSLIITDAGVSQIDLSWVAGNSGVTAITGYQIERESPIGNGFSIIVTDTGSASTSYSDTELIGNTQYNYKVSAINSIGTSDPSNENAGTTSASSGGGGLGGGTPTPTPTLQLFELDLITILPTLSLGQTRVDVINLEWNTANNLQINEINIDTTNIDGIKIVFFQKQAFILPGDSDGISDGIIRYTIQIPSEFCSAGMTINCLTKTKYIIPVELNILHQNRISKQGLAIVVNIGTEESNLALFTIFGAIIIAVLGIRQVTKVGKKKRKNLSRNKRRKAGTKNRKR